MISERQHERAAVFGWPDDEPTNAHPYNGPVICRWLDDARARRVLDLGSGNGSLTRVLATAGLELTGIDASESGIRIARQHSPQIQFVQGWIEDPLPNSLQGRFDAVVAAEVIEHLLLPRMVCARAREALVPGGRLIVTTPYHGYVKNLALAIAGRFDRHWHPLRDGGHVKFFSKATLSELLRSEGFTPRRFVRVGRIPVLANSMILEAQVDAPLVQ